MEEDNGNNEISRKIMRWARRRSSMFSLLFMLVCLVLLGSVLHLYQVHTASFIVVSVEGQKLGLLSSEEELKDIIAGLQQEASFLYGRPVKIAENVQYEDVSRPTGEEEREEVASGLRRELSFLVQAHMVTVDGKYILPLNSEREKEKMIDLVYQEFILEEDNIDLKNIKIVEDISTSLEFTRPHRIKEAEEIAQLLLNGGERRETHLASRGDTLTTNASQNGVSVEEIQELNSHVEEELIRQGDEITINAGTPLVTVITEKEKVEIEKIPYETEYVYDDKLWKERSEIREEGEYGKKEVTYRVISENKEDVEKEKVREKVIEEPSPEIKVKGTSEVPHSGTGSFIWPVDGGGRITSPYGWRGSGFHSGVDIASSTGTPILAADDGVVVFSGWDGGYGNTVVIRHGKYYTLYAHNAQNTVAEGQAVRKGQVIASMGSTGRSTGSHLHFEVRTGGRHGPAQNPMNFY